MDELLKIPKAHKSRDSEHFLASAAIIMKEIVKSSNFKIVDLSIQFLFYIFSWILRGALLMLFMFQLLNAF